MFKLEKEKKSFTDENGKVVEYYQVYLVTPYGQRVAIKATYKSDQAVLKAFASTLEPVESVADRFKL